MYPSLKPFEERTGDIHSAATVIRCLRSSLSAIPGAVVVPFNPPAAFGPGQFGDSRLNSRIWGAIRCTLSPKPRAPGALGASPWARLFSAE